MRAVVVGRDQELAALRDFLAGIADGASVLVLEGDAGMGKTTLWRAAVDEAEAGGLRVLRAQPAESETALSFSGLGDLLDPVLESVLEPLPAGQRSALSRALGLDAADGPAHDARAIGVAVLAALRALARAGSVVVSVDDAQWLDAASASVLAYAVRRLEAEPVGVLLARRTGMESGLLDELRRAASGERLVDVEVGPLGARALHQVLQARLDVALPRPLLAEVHQASGGNPFYALEIVRTLTREGVSVEAGKPLPVPDSLHDVVHGRLQELPRESRDFLAAASAHAHPTIAITEAASGVSAEAGLRPALGAQIVELDRDRIRFTHPLLAAGAYATADAMLRREIHVRLAELLTDPEARAWQLAASVDEPDESVALALEEAAQHARGRGALRPAALLLDRSCRLTPPDRPSEAVRRAVEAAFLHFEAGDSRRAEAQLRDLVAPLARGPERARALVILARIRLYEAPDEARELFEQVVDEAGDDRQTLALAHEGVAACTVWMFEGFDEGLRHADLAQDLAAALGDRALSGDIVMVRLWTETVLGRATAAATAEQALVLQDAAAGLRILDQPLLALAEHWAWTDAYDEARSALVDLARRADGLGDESAQPFLMVQLGQVEQSLGNLEAGLVCACDGREAADQSGLSLFARRALALESLVRAQLGQPEATKHAASDVPDTDPDKFAILLAASALGHLALSQGSPHDVVDLLESHVAFVRRERMAEPCVARFVVDFVEALVELGRNDEAAEVLGWYEENARNLERISALANCARCRGLLAAGAGELDAAIGAFEEALEWHAKVDLPLDRARTLLALGAAQRRVKRRREARVTLEEALGSFERIGAEIWAERARAELKRISGRAATPGALTPAEERVCALVAEGKTNKEVAAALFLSDRTVEGHLAHVFGKLGIRHRTELARALQTHGIDMSNKGDSPVSPEPSAS